MGYSVDEWFDEEILPELKKLVQKDPAENDILLDFFRVLKSVIGRSMAQGDTFAGYLINNIIHPDDEPSDMVADLRKCFLALTSDDDRELLSVSYRQGDAVVNIDYNQPNKDE